MWRWRWRRNHTVSDRRHHNLCPLLQFLPNNRCFVFRPFSVARCHQLLRCPLASLRRASHDSYLQIRAKMASSLVGATLNILRTRSPCTLRTSIADQEIRSPGRGCRSGRYEPHKAPFLCSQTSLLTPGRPEPSEAGEKEIFSSWALFILIVLLIAALFTSYILQQKKIQAVHETVISIFAGAHSPQGRTGLH